MKSLCTSIGVGLLAIGVGILLSYFLPKGVLVFVESLLLILAGFFLLKK